MDKKQAKLARLRERAEAVLDQAPDAPQYMPQNPDVLMQELHVSQLELELQLADLQKSYDALANAQKRYTKLFDSAPVGYLVMDTAGKILKANLAASRLLGMERDELEGSVFADYIVADFQDSFHFCRQAVLHQRQAQRCEIQLERQDESRFPVLLNADLSDLHSEELCLTITDISSLKESRTITTQTLAREKELEPLRMEVLSLIAPDFHSPLISILSSLKLLYQYGNRLTVRKRQSLYQSSRNLIWYLLDNLQNARSIQESQHDGQLQLESFDLFVFCHQIIDDMEVIVSEGRKIVVDAVSKDESSQVIWDANLFRRILMNLLIHALKASRKAVHCQLRLSEASIHLHIKYQADSMTKDSLQRQLEALDPDKVDELIHGRGNSLALVFDAVHLYEGSMRFVSHAGGVKSVHIQVPRQLKLLSRYRQ